MRLFLSACVLLLATSARGDMVCNKALCAFAWEHGTPTPAVSSYRYEVQWEVEGAAPSLYHVVTNKVYVPKPDTSATKRAHLRVRRSWSAGSLGAAAYPAGKSEWSEWSDWVLGVPVGYDADWNRDGVYIPGDDAAALTRAEAEGWKWPR